MFFTPILGETQSRPEIAAGTASGSALYHLQRAVAGRADRPQAVVLLVAGFSMDDKVWYHSTFTKNRGRLLEGEVAYKFFSQVPGQLDDPETD